MTLQENNLRNELIKAMQEWIEDNCDSDDWGSTAIVIHSEMSVHMAEAAFSVFQAANKSQQYLREENG